MQFPGLILCLSLLATVPKVGVAQESYLEQVQVSAPTSLDWTFAVAEKSLAEPPADWLPAGYRAQDQSYQLYVPEQRQGPEAGFPLVLFVSPSRNNAGWQHWQGACRPLGCFFVGPHAAGNDTPLPLRIRIVLDAFDDVLRRYPIDPDRTYVAGFSGGGHVAGQIGLLLPEHFGGVIAISGSLALPEDVLLGQRACERLTASLVTGRLDASRGMVEHLFQPLLTESGLETRLRVFPRLGHALPRGDQLLEVLQWHESSLPRRRALAERQPATRAPDQGPFGPLERAQAILSETTQQLAVSANDARALRQLEMISEKWPNTPAAQESLTQLSKLEPTRRQAAAQWRDAKNYRRYRANAIGSEKFALNTKATGKYGALRQEMARSAVRFWESVQRGTDTDRRREAGQRLQALSAVAGETKSPESR